MLRSYSIFAFIVLFFMSLKSYSQSNDTIRTGRPGQAIGPYVVGTGYFQIQSGLDFASSENSIDRTKSQISNNVVRYGLTENFELSALVNIQNDRHSLSSLADTSGLSEMHLGFRYNLVDHPDGWIPGFGIDTRNWDAVASVKLNPLKEKENQNTKEKYQQAC